MQRDFLFTLAVLGALLPAAAFGAEYSRALPEVPLMPGMKEQAAPAAAVQGMPAPLQTTGTITGNRRMVVSFYNQALRADGWEPASDDLKSWRKDDGETLRIGITEDKAAGTTTVMFTVNRPRKPGEKNDEPAAEEAR